MFILSFWLSDCYLFFLFLSIFGNSFSCLQYSLLASTYVATEINHLSKLQWHYIIGLIPHSFKIPLFIVRNNQIYFVGYTLLIGFLDSFAFNTLYIARGTWRNSHLCRRFWNPESLMLSARNWDVAAAYPWSSAKPADSTFGQIALNSQHVSPHCSHFSHVNMHWFSIINYNHSCLCGWHIGLESWRWGTVKRVNG